MPVSPSAALLACAEDLLPCRALLALTCPPPVQVGLAKGVGTIAAIKGSRADNAQRVTSLLQVLLTGEPALVSLSAALLEDVLRSNPSALASLYQTGAFFFALAYCGSNLAEIAQLFRVRYCADMSWALSGPPYLHQQANDTISFRQVCNLLSCIQLLPCTTVLCSAVLVPWDC